MNPIYEEIKQQLKQSSDLHTKSTGEHFFKEKVKIYGVKTALVTKIAKAYNKQILAMDKAPLFALCKKLWQSGFMEESFVACHFSYLIRKNYLPEDFAVFENWVKNYLTNWASCDTFCNHTLGAFIEKYPQYLKRLYKWTKSKNRWVRRAAAVSLIVPARRGQFLAEILKIVDSLLLDKDDLVQKGYGWLLKVTSQTHQSTVFNYVIRHKAKMPRTALRYAIEKMPAELKARAMAKE